jgi:hypothetical protein
MNDYLIAYIFGYFLLLGDRLDYWPSRKKFRWRNKTYARWQYKGTVQDFIADRLKRMNHE